MEAGRAFQILVVRIRNEDAKRFVRFASAVDRPRREADPYGVLRFDGKKLVRAIALTDYVMIIEIAEIQF
ncbi:jg8478 [Pararge aegeria aegeria]|uniref:Jg8478 protein n=1 Tax=Pararge aegeria aegeria TaxID=348720 RepID=A0A8S4RZH0_9NEOP|nr:jg8478 [Pararge aegeria aegeria]